MIVIEVEPLFAFVPFVIGIKINQVLLHNASVAQP